MQPSLARRAALSFVAFLLLAGPSAGQDAAPERGRALAEENCARCHAVGRDDQSPLAEAPPFRTLHERYPVESLAEALAEGILTGHRDMPQFAFEPEEIEDLLQYLKSLER
jgi:mono/diheme cytochrome c family protein